MFEMGRQRHSRRHGEKIMYGREDRLDAGGAEVRGPLKFQALVTGRRKPGACLGEEGEGEHNTVDLVFDLET